MVKATSWGRLPDTEQTLVPLSETRHVAQVLSQAKPGIVFGNGRSYGDMCLNPGSPAWDSRYLDHLMAFDCETGILQCEAGVLLRDIHRITVSRGWMLPVTPGTQLITVGGAIANDVHGKNHHGFGTFGEHVRLIKLIRTDGQEIECGPQTQPDWFAATVGGLGLTGVMVEVELQLQKISSAMLDIEKIPYSNLQDFLALADDSEADWEHTVSWIDCTTRSRGRGIFLRARPSSQQHLKNSTAKNSTVPFAPPISLINGLTVKPLTAGYYKLQELTSGSSVAHFEKFLYPLDSLLGWNRLYGPKGFYQYQCVLPRESGIDALNAMLQEISQSGNGSFLSVLKTFTDRPPMGLLSFPRPGITLALDFPNAGPRTLALFDRLDAVVRAAEGRLYLAKDARLPKDFFRESYPRVEAFLQFRDPGISSGMSRRLMES